MKIVILPVPIDPRKLFRASQQDLRNDKDMFILISSM
jgi:hypothetical protein